MAFRKRRIELAVKLAANTQTNQPNVFADSGTDTVTLAGLRTSVRIQNSGGAAGNSADVTVWGLSSSLMNQLSTLGAVVSIIPRNTLTVTAGDDVTGMSVVFIGTITNAYADYTGAPSVSFRFECQSAGAESVIPYPVSSFTGATDIVTILSGIANRQRWGFENNGVTGQLSNPYLSGTAMEQVRAVREAAQINAEVLSNVLCIWPRYGARTNGAGIPLLSRDTGMIGYPAFTQQGISVRCEFNPAIIFGGQIKVVSDVFTTQSLTRIQSQESIWNVSKLDLALDAEMPDGEWMSSIFAYNPRFPQPLPPQVRS